MTTWGLVSPAGSRSACPAEATGNNCVPDLLSSEQGVPSACEAGNMPPLVYLYIFAMAVGAVLLGASLLLGGDSDADVDLDVDLDVDVDADPGGLDVDHGGGGFEIFGTLRSVRFWTFFTAFFGLTGVVLTVTEITEIVTLLASLGVGIVSGWAAALAVRTLSRDAGSELEKAEGYIGKTGTVLLPVEPGATGKIRVRVGGTTVDMLATTEDKSPIGAKDEAIIIGIEGHRAKVAKLEK